MRIVDKVPLESRYLGLRLQSAESLNTTMFFVRILLTLPIDQTKSRQTRDSRMHIFRTAQCQT